MVFSIVDWCEETLLIQRTRTDIPPQGTTDKGAFCETCGQSSVNCVGHYAYIKLVVPVFHIGYFKHTIGILQAICKVRSITPTLTYYFLDVGIRPAPASY
jgi:hypothetical protein